MKKIWEISYLERDGWNCTSAHCTCESVKRLFIQRRRKGAESVSEEVEATEGLRGTMKCQFRKRKRKKNSHFQPTRVSSSSNPPIPSRHTLKIIAVHPDTLRTIFGYASDGLTLNSNTLNLRVDRSSGLHPPRLVMKRCRCRLWLIMRTRSRVVDI